MTITSDLSEAWMRLVAKGTIAQTFVDNGGRMIENGVRMGADGPEFYGKDVQAQTDINTPFEKLGHFIWAPCRSSGALMVLPHLPQLLTQSLTSEFVSLARANANAV